MILSAVSILARHQGRAAEAVEDELKREVALDWGCCFCMPPTAAEEEPDFLNLAFQVQSIEGGHKIDPSSIEDFVSRVGRGIAEWRPTAHVDCASLVYYLSAYALNGMLTEEQITNALKQMAE